MVFGPDHEDYGKQKFQREGHLIANDTALDPFLSKPSRPIAAYKRL